MWKSYEMVDDPFVDPMDKYPQMDPEEAEKHWEEMQKSGSSALILKLDPKTGKPPVLIRIKD